MQRFLINHIEILLEEPSAEAALQNIIPKIVNDKISFKIHVFEGKRDLIIKLPNRLRGYRRWIPDDWIIVVLIDNDNDDCFILKEKLEQIAIRSGLITKAHQNILGKYNIVNRIAIEELEAWFLGDKLAVNSAYPKVSIKIFNNRRYRNPDNILGGTWEALHRILKKSGYYRSGFPKIEVARNISRYMDINKNESKSFQVFRDTLLDLASFSESYL
jgi:hypothetical protein